MARYDYIIAIDPDVEKSGVALMDVAGRRVECSAMNLPALVDYIRTCKARSERIGGGYVVVVEAGWMAETNWHVKRGDRMQKIASIGAKVGRNHEIGRQILLFCEHFDFPCEAKRPLVKCWKGPDRKITQDEILSLMAGSGVKLEKCRMNQEMRDAALLALDRSGVTMRMIKH